MFTKARHKYKKVADIKHFLSGEYLFRKYSLRKSIFLTFKRMYTKRYFWWKNNNSKQHTNEKSTGVWEGPWGGGGGNGTLLFSPPYRNLQWNQIMDVDRKPFLPSLKGLGHEIDWQKWILLERNYVPSFPLSISGRYFTVNIPSLKVRKIRKYVRTCYYWRNKI